MTEKVDQHYEVVRLQNGEYSVQLAATGYEVARTWFQDVAVRVAGLESTRAIRLAAACGESNEKHGNKAK